MFGRRRVVRGVGVGHQRIERVVAAREIQDDQVPRGRTLSPGDVGEKCRRGIADCDRRDSIADESSPSDVSHGRLGLRYMNWYSAEPR